MNNKTHGVIKQIIGPIVDIEFQEKELPNILTALRATNTEINKKKII